jgi:hypothetical protein
MNEEGIKFLRYVVPGLVFFVETLLFAYIILPEQTGCFLNDHFKDLGTAATVFLASGGLGFIFASIHHFVHWQPCFSYFEEDIFDHRKVIKKLRDSQLIELDEMTLEKINCSHQTIAKMEALKHSQSLWYELLKPRHAGKVAIDNLGHLAQGLGAARIASVFALFSAICLMQYVSPMYEPCAIARTLLMLFISISVIYMFHTGYRRVADLAHDQYTITLCKKALDNTQNSTGKS